MSGVRLADTARALRAVVENPQLRRAEAAFALACTSEMAFTVTLLVVAFRAGGAAAVGLVALLRMLPSAFGAPFLTSYADRMRRERVLIAVSAARAAAIGAAALLPESGAGAVGIYALAVVATVAVTIFRPVHSALLPLLCTDTMELTSANVVRGILEAGATLLGPALAGVLLAGRGTSAAFAVIAVVSLLGAVPLLRIDYDHRAPATGRPGERRATILRDAAEGIRTVVRHRELRLVFGLGFAQTVVRGALNVFIVVVALELLDTGEASVAVFSAALGVGAIVGSLAASLLVGSRHLGAWLALALGLWGAPIALIGVSPQQAAVFALLAVIGLANAVIDVPLFTLPVRLAPDAVLARAFGVFESLIALGVGLGSALSPALIGVVGARPAMVVTGLLLPLLGVAYWRRLAALDARLGVRDDEIRVLRATPMLALLPVPTIEHLAARLRRRTVTAGTAVFEEGDPGGSFFVVSNGYGDVVGNGDVIGAVGPGDGFGEIAIMNDVPRTATIRARTDLEVFELDRDDFLDAVASNGASTDAAHGVVARHLADYHPLSLGT